MESRNVRGCFGIIIKWTSRTEKAWKEELEIRLDRKGKLTRCKEALFEVGRVKYCGAIVCITRLAGDNLSSAVTWNRELPLAIKGKNLAQLRYECFFFPFLVDENQFQPPQKTWNISKRSARSVLAIFSEKLEKIFVFLESGNDSVAPVEN